MMSVFCSNSPIHAPECGKCILRDPNFQTFPGGNAPGPALGVFQYLSAYFSNSAIYSISYWKPCDTELNKWLERHKKNLLLDAPQGHEDEDD